MPQNFTVAASDSSVALGALAFVLKCDVEQLQRLTWHRQRHWCEACAQGRKGMGKRAVKVGGCSWQGTKKTFDDDSTAVAALRPPTTPSAVIDAAPDRSKTVDSGNVKRTRKQCHGVRADAAMVPQQASKRRRCHAAKGAASRLTASGATSAAPRPLALTRCNGCC